MTLQVGDLAAVLRLDDSKFNSGLASAESKFAGLGGKAGAVGSAIGSALATGAAVGTAAVGAALVGGTKAFADYEQGLASVSKTTGLTGESLKGLGDELRAMSTAGPVTVGELESIAAAAGSLGIESSKIGEFTKTISDMAVAFEMDAETVATSMADIGNVYKIPVEGLSELGSQINVLENSMSATAPQIIDFMGAFGGTASLFGESAASTAAFGATLSELGIKGVEASTQLRSGVLQLTQSTKEGQANMEAMAKIMGVSVEDLAGMIDKDLYGSLIKMGQAFKGIEGDTQKAAAAQKIFGAYGYSALIKLGDGADEYAEALGRVNVKGDELTKEARTMANTIEGQWQRMKNGINDVGISIGEITEGPFKGFLNYVNTQAIPGIKEFVVAIGSGDWGKAGEVLKEAFTGAWEYIQAIDWGAVASTAVSLIKAGWQGLQSLGSDLLGWLQGIDWGSVASTITGAIQAGWVALVNLGADLAGWIRDYDWGGLAGDVAGLIKAGWAKVTGWATDIISGVKKGWDDWIASDGPSKLGESLGKAIATGAKDIGSWICDHLTSWFTKNGKSIGSTLGSLIDFAVSAAKAAWDFAKSFGSTILTAGKGTIGAAILEIIGGAMDSVWEGAGDSLREKAKEWRASAEKLFAAEDFDVDLSTTYTGAGDPRDLSKTDIPVNFRVSVSGDIWYLKKKTEKGSKEEKQYGSWMPAGAYDSEEAAAAAAQKMTEAAEKVTTATDGLATATTAQAAATQLQADTTTAQTAQFVSTAEKANALTMGIFETSAKLIQSTAETTAASQKQSTLNLAEALAKASQRTLEGSQTAARTLQTGAEVGGRSMTQGGQAVMIGLTQSGQEIAVIGRVAQQNFAKAGGDLYGKVSSAGNALRSGGNDAANALRNGANSAASALSNAVSRLYAMGDLLYSGTSSGRWYSSGTETTGPEVALIGEAGREWVIPERTKRWDLLYSAMRAYGIRDLAGGGVVRSMSSARLPDTPNTRAIIIEDHTSHHWYLDGKEVTNHIMKSATRQIRFKGAMPSR